MAPVANHERGACVSAHQIFVTGVGMQFYTRHIGDYYKKASRLTPLQHGVYNLLMDACYDREAFPTRDEAVEWVWASTPEEVQAVDFVLQRFFKQGGDGRWVQNRIADELEAYREYCRKQAENGKRGGRPKGSGLNGAGDKKTHRLPNENPPVSDGFQKWGQWQSGGFENETQKKPKPLPITHEPQSMGVPESDDSAPSTVVGGKKRKGAKVTLAEYLNDRKAKGLEKVFDAGSAVESYGRKADIPDNWIALAWIEFRHRYSEGTSKGKRYADWAAVFLNALKNNWFKLWYYDKEQEKYLLTTIGVQAEKAARMRQANGKQGKE